MHDVVVVYVRELVKDVFLTNVITRVKNNRISVKILNDTEKEITLPYS